MLFPATHTEISPKEKWRDLLCLLTARISFGSFAEGEEERAAETSSRSINKEEVTLPTIRVPHTWSPGSHRRSPARGSGTWALLPLQPWQGWFMPYWEWNARSHGAGASAQENRLFGFEFFHPFSCQAAPLFHGSYSARAQAFAPGKVSLCLLRLPASSGGIWRRAASLTSSRAVAVLLLSGLTFGSSDDF